MPRTDVALRDFRMIASGEETVRKAGGLAITALTLVSFGASLTSYGGLAVGLGVGTGAIFTVHGAPLQYCVSTSVRQVGRRCVCGVACGVH